MDYCTMNYFIKADNEMSVSFIPLALRFEVPMK